MEQEEEESGRRGWDSCMRFLTRTDPQAFLDWLLPGAIYQGSRPEKIKMWEIEADAVIDALYEKKKLIVHVESQTYNDATMGFRLLQYNVLLVAEHNRPVRSYVVHLLSDGHIPRSPYSMKAPGPSGEQEVARFFYESVELAELAPNDLFRQERIILLPLVPFTKGGATVEVADRIFSALKRGEDFSSVVWRQIVFVASLFTEWALKRSNPSDLEQFQRRYRHMFNNDLIRETPLYQEITAREREEGREEGKAMVRQLIVDSVSADFPELAEMAKEHVASISNFQELRELFLEIKKASQYREQLIAALQRGKQNGVLKQ